MFVLLIAISSYEILVAIIQDKPVNINIKRCFNMSNANKMKELAGIFGLELGEEFNIVHNGEYSKYNPHVFTEDGLVDKDDVGAPFTLDLLRGLRTIEKLPFRPKEGQLYYTFGFTLNVISIHWAGCKYDMERKLLGIVFRTEQEAIDYLPIYEKRLRGEEGLGW